MTRELVTTNLSDTAVGSLRVMTEKRVRHLPVVEGTKMIEVLSAQAATIDNLEQYISGASLD